MRAALLLGMGLWTISNALAQVQVPLVVRSVEGNQRIEVHLRIGDDSASRLFLLDTGSTILLLDNDIPLSGSSTPTGESGSVSYGINSSDTFDFDVYRDAVSFSNPAGDRLATAPNFSFGKNTSTDNPVGAFHGILGFGPGDEDFDPGGFTLFTLISQIDFPTDIHPGFTIALTPGGADGTLTIGVSKSQWNNTAMKFPMPTFGDSHGCQLSLPVTLRGFPPNPFAVSSGQPILVKLDTGDPEVSLVFDTTDFPQVQPGYLGMAVGGGFAMNAGTTLGVGTSGAGFSLAIDNVSRASTGIGYEDASTNYPHLNTGILPFLTYAVTFVLDDGTGQAFVSFAPLGQPRPEIFFRKHQTTRQRTLRIRGTASTGTTSVFYRTLHPRGKWRPARGLDEWSFRARGLEPGKNVFQIRALGADSASPPVRLIVRRKKP